MKKPITNAWRLGFVFLIPPNITLLILTTWAFLSFKRMGTRKRPGTSPIWIYCGINLLFASSSLIGINAGMSEATNYLQRALVACWLAMIIFYSLDWSRPEYFTDFLRGVMMAAFINSACVISFALSPNLYDALHVSSISGFDKGTRFLRSPGLLRGTDAAGYLAVFGILIYFYLGGRKAVQWTRAPWVVYVLLFSTLLCSRSSMLLGGLILFLLMLKWSDRMDRKTLVGLGIIATAGLAISGFMLMIVFLPGVLNFDITTEFSGVSIESIYYLANSEDYIHQWSLSDLLTLTPSGDSTSVDNLFLKTLSSMGIIGFMIAILAMATFCAVIIWRSRGDERFFIMLYVLIFVYANFKNNYFFFIPYVIVNTVLLSRLSYRRTAVPRPQAA